MHLLKKYLLNVSRLPKKMNWPNINTMHHRFICAWKQPKSNLSVVFNIFSSLCVGSLFIILLHYFFTCRSGRKSAYPGASHFPWSAMWKSCVGRQQGRRWSVRQFQWKDLPFSLLSAVPFNKKRDLATFTNFLSLSEGPFSSQRIKGHAATSNH